MASPFKRSVVIGGRKSSVSLEHEFWAALKEIAAGRGLTAGQLIATIDDGREQGNLSSTLRLFVLDFFRHRASDRRTVLVVDDDPLVLELAAAMLEDLGCAVVAAADGTEALAKIAQDQRIEVLLTDINMPGLSGCELAERARRMRPSLQVILLSGREMDGRGLPLVRRATGRLC
jgi:CheY-like chemotaxis protein